MQIKGAEESIVRTSKVARHETGEEDYRIYNQSGNIKNKFYLFVLK